MHPLPSILRDKPGSEITSKSLQSVFKAPPIIVNSRKRHHTLSISNQHVIPCKRHKKESSTQHVDRQNVIDNSQKQNFNSLGFMYSDDDDEEKNGVKSNESSSQKSKIPQKHS